jgi:hypothetical protein
MHAYHVLFEICRTELPGHEMYGHLGGWEKYRQHQTFYAENGLQIELDAWYDTVGLWLYMREYIKALGLKSSIDTETQFTGHDLVCATLHIERNREAHMRRVNPQYDWTLDANNDSHFSTCKTIFEDLLREWCGSSLIISKRYGKKHDVKTYSLKVSTELLRLKKPPVNAIIRLNPTTKEPEMILPSIDSSWVHPPKGNLDAYKEHHGIMMHHNAYDAATMIMFSSYNVFSTPGSNIYEQMAADVCTNHDLTYGNTHADSPHERLKSDICRTRMSKHLFS